ncbi:RNA polymerase sigma-28 (SigD/FliA/WhiG) subunit [Tibeticola sediminis]|jgi:RNA polymerase sigma factor for flagellar operon FliA|uniref:RNA polymerase sigma-28 (SigD/FliA/WhiG) subunit n=1 Tax=Tibeticola sediminis TaxID=1917811 RepID=A0A3N4USM3_9BURK|nr:FliA/WhiG family RNA polymerase sigma factor [Tibeticola sediminis]RPE70521.1 RNA polymerase sigma-28 (SigD/FliA/WhiG) subunit [Tibeticola sediminis]
MKTQSYAPAGAQDERLREMLPMVRRIAGQMAAQLPSSVDVADLEQAGMIGLWDALERGQEQSPAQFATYAAVRIRGAIYDELRRMDWLPRRSRAKERGIQKAIETLTQRLGRPPKEEEISAELGLGLEAYREALAECSLYLVSLEDLAAAEGEDFLDRHVAGTQPLPEQILASEELARDLEQAIAELPERERLVLALYYQEDLQLKEVGAVLGVTESRVSQLMKQAVLRLRARLASHGAAAVPAAGH